MNHFKADGLGILLLVFAALTLGMTGLVAFRFYLPATRKAIVPVWPVFIWALGVLGVADTVIEIIRVHGQFPFALAGVSGAAVFIGFFAMGANYKRFVRRV